VLVEGESDRAAIKAIAGLKKVDFESLGVAVLPVSSKNNIDRPGAIFLSLEIPVYAIWDCDRKGETIEGEDTNRALQRLFGSAEQEISAASTRIEDGFACFEGNLEQTLANELGTADFAAAIEAAKQQFSIQRKDDACKSPAVMEFALTKLSDEGLRSASLESILEKICALKAKHSVPLEMSQGDANEFGQTLVG
jgi:predicted ATP-dependent endonuclease of OLD family